MLGGAGQLFVGNFHFAEEDFAGVERDAAECGVVTARGCSQISLSMKCL